MNENNENEKNKENENEDEEINKTKETKQTKNTKNPPPVLMLLSDGCVEDMNSLLLTTVVTNLCVIVGYDIDGNLLQPLPPVHWFIKLIDPFCMLRHGGVLAGERGEE